MDGFRVRFEHGRGHRMVLEGEPAIRPDELDRVQLRMLIPSACPGLLRFETEELDGTVALRYSLAGRRMLAAELRSGRWTMPEALAALCRLAEILEQGREYMLDLERFALEDEFIFVGEERHDLALVYLPLKERQATASVAASFEKLIVRWMMNADAPDGVVLQRLLKLTASPDFSPGALLRAVRQYLADRAVHGDRPGTPGGEAAFAPAATAATAAAAAEPSGRTPHRSFPPEPVREGASAEPVRDPARAPGEGKSPARLSLADPHSLSGLLGADNGKPAVPAEPIGKEAADPARKTVMLLGGAAIVLALVWKFLYFPHPDRKSLLMATGLSLVTAAAAIWAWKGGGRSGAKRRPAADRTEAGAAERNAGAVGAVPGQSPAGRPSEAWPQAALPPAAGSVAGTAPGLFGAEEAADSRSPASRAAARWPSPFGGEAARADERDDSAPADPWGRFDSAYGRGGSAHAFRERGAQHAGDGAGKRSGGAGNGAGTDPWREGGGGAAAEEAEAKTSWLPTDRDETALLSPELAATAKEPYLEWESGGVKKKVRLRGESVVIGRSREAAHHVDDAQGVSRAHLELVRGNGTWQARDLGSRNGSWLNGVPMAPYESYPLREGDSIQIATSLYRFNLG